MDPLHLIWIIPFCVSVGVFVRILLRSLPLQKDGTRASNNLQTVLAQMDPWHASG